MMAPESKHARDPLRHHYVPKFILSPWVREWKPRQKMLRGYFWDARSDAMRHKDRGVDAFCYGIDLLALKGRREGRALLETRFFQHIDTKGAEAIAAIIASGPDNLSLDQRQDFARLLLSLDVRRPASVKRLRQEAERYRDAFDDDPELLKVLAARGIEMSPSAYAEKHLGSFDDRVMLIIQRLVDNPAVGKWLINANWHVKKLRPEQGSLMLGDRPLIRTHAYNHPDATWILPLAPHCAFVAATQHENVRRLKKVSPPTFVYRTNQTTAALSEKYVFTVDERHEVKLTRYLREKNRSSGS